VSKSTRPSSPSRRRWRPALVVAASLALTAVVAAPAAAAPEEPAATASKKTPSKVVAAVQEKLGIPADGIAGRQTKRAVRRFQRSSGLTVDGVIGPQTLAALGLDGRAREARKKARARSGADAATTAILEAIAECESGGDPTAISSSGLYRGKYQFSVATWRAVGGKGDPAKAAEAEQDRLAAVLYKQAGASPWPVCGARAA
jgi:hypothetical protein